MMSQTRRPLFNVQQRILLFGIHFTDLKSNIRVLLPHPLYEQIEYD